MTQNLLITPDPAIDFEASDRKSPEEVSSLPGIPMLGMTTLCDVIRHHGRKHLLIKRSKTWSKRSDILHLLVKKKFSE